MIREYYLHDLALRVTLSVGSGASDSAQHLFSQQNIPPCLFCEHYSAMHRDVWRSLIVLDC